MFSLSSRQVVALRKEQVIGYCIISVWQKVMPALYKICSCLLFLVFLIPIYDVNPNASLRL